MKYDSQHITSVIGEWRRQMVGYQLPEWEDFPSLELYMDQVTILVNQYLATFDVDKTAENAVTPAMINNYVKMKIVPAPVKKRYTKIHLAYLVMVCTLKQTLSMEMIRKLLPVDLAEDELRSTYQIFVRNQKKTFEMLLELLDKKPMLALTDSEEGEVRDIVLQSAVFSNLSRTLTRMLLTLPEKEEK